MTMLRKIIDCQNFKNSQENVEDRVCFSKVASQCADCTLFSENVPKTSFLKRTFFKKFMVVLGECGTAVHIPHFHKTRVNVRPD